MYISGAVVSKSESQSTSRGLFSRRVEYEFAVHFGIWWTVKNQWGEPEGLILFFFCSLECFIWSWVGGAGVRQKVLFRDSLKRNQAGKLHPRPASGTV